MTDLLLDGHDIAIIDGDLALVSGGAAVGQHALMRLRTFLAECVYDRGAGVPWVQVVFERGTPLYAVESIITQTLANTPGVLEVLSVELTHDRAAGTATGRASIRVTDGPVELSIGPIGVP